MADYLNVLPGGAVPPDRVVLWERNPAHPGPDHEVWIVAPPAGETAKPTKVGRTSDVDRLLRAGELVEAPTRKAPLGKDD